MAATANSDEDCFKWLNGRECRIEYCEYVHVPQKYGIFSYRMKKDCPYWLIGKYPRGYSCNLTHRDGMKGTRKDYLTLNFGTKSWYPNKNNVAIPDSNSDSSTDSNSSSNSDSTCWITKIKTYAKPVLLGGADPSPI